MCVCLFVCVHTYICLHTYASISVLLDSEHVLEVGGVVSVTLGHGFTSTGVRHDFYGSERVVKDLERMPGFADGLLHFRPGPIVRGADGHVLGFSAAHLVPPQSG